MFTTDPFPVSPQHADNLVRLRRAIDEAFLDVRPTIPADEVFTQLRAHHAERIKGETSTDNSRLR